MTAALSLTSDLAPAPPAPPPVGAEWISADVAAARMGLSIRRVRQLADLKWAPAGLAVLDESGAWAIRTDAHPKLARVLYPEQLPCDLRRLTEAQRRTVLERKRLLDEWLAARAAGLANLPADRVTAAFIATHPGCSHGSLHRWLRAFRAVGLEGLVDGRALRSRPKADDPFLEEVKRVWLTRNRQFKLPLCIAAATVKAADNGWPVRSLSACRRAVDAIPKAVAIKCRQGNEAFVNQAEPFITRDYSTLFSNEVWCGDHHCCDVWVRAPGNRLVRPWLTAWEDMRSRYVPGWVIRGHDPNSDTILEAFRAGVLEHGLPGNTYIDNGKDYKARVFVARKGDDERLRGVFQSLGVSKCHATPYHPQSKPIERFFGTVEERFGKLWPTYCGNCPDTRPEDLGERLKDAPTLDQFIAAFRDWLRDDYHARPHFGDAMEGKTPAAVYAACLERKRTAPAELLDLLCLRPSKPVTVTRQGVRYDGLVYHDPALFALLRQKVQLRVDDRDRSQVHVFTLDGRFVCLPKSVVRLPFLADSAALREAHKLKRAARRQVREYSQWKTVRASLETLPQTMARAAAERAAQTPPPPPANPGVIQPIRSPLEKELPAIQRAKRSAGLRMAAGAESMSAPGQEPFITDAERRDFLTPPPLRSLAALMQDAGDPWEEFGKTRKAAVQPIMRSMTELVKHRPQPGAENGGSDGSKA